MRRAFTLLELVISVTLTLFLFVVMINVINSLKNTEKSLNIKKDYFIKTIYYDIMNAKKISIVKGLDNNFNRIYLKTANSLYGFIEPYVLWVVKGRNLYRIESKDVINLPGEFKHFDEFSKNVKIFRVYEKKGKYLVFLKDKKDRYFEFVKGKK
jgi:hypothetical protein